MSAAPQPINGPEVQAARVLESIRQHGKLLLDYASRPRVENVVVNSNEELLVQQTGGFFESKGRFHGRDTDNFLSKIASYNRARFDYDNPVLETSIDGVRVTGIRPPLVEHIVLALRPHPKVVRTLAEYDNGRVLTQKGDALNAKRAKSDFADLTKGRTHTQILETAVDCHLNIVVGGSTGSGKTTFTNSVIGEFGRRTPFDRTVSIEDTPELQVPLCVRNSVSLYAVNGWSMKDCLKVTLRLNPHRIVVGEVRDDSAAILINAWNTGHSGGIATIHADDALGVLQRLEELTPATPRASIARAVNMVVFIDREESIEAGRKVRQVLLVKGFDKDTGEYVTEEV